MTYGTLTRPAAPPPSADLATDGRRLLNLAITIAQDHDELLIRIDPRLREISRHRRDIEAFVTSCQRRGVTIYLTDQDQPVTPAQASLYDRIAQPQPPPGQEQDACIGPHSHLLIVA